MTIAEFCILIAALLPYVASGIAKRTAKGFDNAVPRDPSKFEGRSLRAWNAQLNGFEAFPFFAIAVLYAELRSSAHLYIDILAVLFIVIRLAHLYFYLSDKPTLRSAAFSLGLLVPIALFFLPLLIR